MRDHTYLLMLIKIWPGDWEKNLEETDTRVNEENGRSMGRRRIRKFWQFSRNEYWKSIGCLILAPSFGIGGSRL